MQGWFPIFASAKKKAAIASRKARFLKDKAVVEELQQRQLLAEREANRELGLFSKYGIGAAKASFWCATCAAYAGDFAHPVLQEQFARVHGRLRLRQSRKHI